MASGLVRVPFHVPGCDILSGIKNTNTRQPVRVRVAPDQQWRKVEDENGLPEMARHMWTIARDKHQWTTQNESREGFMKIISTENVAFPDLIAACARLLDNANNKTDGMEGMAFIIMIQLLLGGQESKHFLDAVRTVQPPADNIDDATKVAFVLLGRQLYVTG
jgi:hypothetical protein